MDPCLNDVHHFLLPGDSEFWGPTRLYIFLGPLLFILYINSLPSAVSDSTMKIFADEYCLVGSVNDCFAFQNDLDLIFDWCSKW